MHHFQFPLLLHICILNITELNQALTKIIKIGDADITAGKTRRNYQVKKIFKMLTSIKITGRTSSITISEIHNLIPSCGKCNQSKGNRNRKTWMLGNTPLSPHSRQIPDIEYRIAK